MSGYPFPGPIAYGNNFPINAQYFEPSRFVISNITLGESTTVDTSTENNYVLGQMVRLLVPPYYGTFQLDEQTGIILNILSSTSFILNIYSLGMDAFIPTPSYGPTLPQVVAIGDINTGLISSTGRSLPTTTIPGAFENISPL
jgi:hypothetical protein